MMTRILLIHRLIGTADLVFLTKSPLASQLLPAVGQLQGDGCDRQCGQGWASWS